MKIIRKKYLIINVNDRFDIGILIKKLKEFVDYNLFYEKRNLDGIHKWSEIIDCLVESDLKKISKKIHKLLQPPKNKNKKE